MAHGRKNLISFMANRKRALPEGCQEQERKKSRVESGTSAGHSGCLQVPETEEVPKLELLAQAVIVGEVVGSLTCTSVPFGFWKALPFFRTHESDPFYLFATGMCFWHGQGCSVNYETAALLWTKAADKGYIPAQYALGMCYWNGTGVKRDDRKAVALFHESSQFSLSQTMLGTFYQIQRKKAETNQWLSAAAIQDDPEAQYKLGLCYETGFFSEQDLKLAFFWYKKAAKQGHRAAQTCVGGCYFYGKGVPTDSEQSFEWNMKSALQGSGTSLYNVGMAYMDKKDYEKSREFFKKSVDAGYPFGSAGLGKLHYLGKGGFHVNLEEAEKLYSAAAANVSKSEYYHCGWICIDLANIFLKKNPPEVENSVRWYLKARKMNDKFTAASFLAKPSVNPFILSLKWPRSFGWLHPNCQQSLYELICIFVNVNGRNDYNSFRIPSSASVVTLPPFPPVQITTPFKYFPTFSIPSLPAYCSSCSAPFSLPIPTVALAPFSPSFFLPREIEDLIIKMTIQFWPDPHRKWPVKI